MAGSQLFNRVVIPLDDPAGKCFAESFKPSNSKAAPIPLQESFRNGAVAAKPTMPQPEANPRQDAKLLGNERRVSIVRVQVTGARAVCNGTYCFDGLHQAKPLFRAESGAIIYFQRFWKMNAVYKTSSWMYSFPDSRTAWPPEGEWTREGSVEITSGSAPVVSLVDEPFKSLGEQGNSLRLEGGRSVLKREENKSWRWIELPVYANSQTNSLGKLEESAGDQAGHMAVPSLEELCAQLDAEETADDVAPDGLNFGLLGGIDDKEEEERAAPPANGYLSSDMIRQMGEGMLVRLSQDARSSQQSQSTRSPEACEGPPWPLEEPRIGMAARLMKSDAESQRGESGNLLRANRLRFR